MLKTNNTVLRAAKAELFPIGLTEAASYLLLAAVFLLPLHTQIFYKAIPLYLGLPSGLVSVWKEILFFIAGFIFAVNLLTSRREIKITHVDAGIFLFLLLLICLTLLADDLGLALYGFRVFMEPFVIYLLAKAARFDFYTIKRFLKLFFVLSVLISIWAIFQAAVLGDDFLLSLGYEGKDGRLHHSFHIAMFFFQRAVGTFSSPNTFGLFLHFSILSGVFLMRSGMIRSRAFYIICNIFLFAALAYSFSRSSWLALFISAVSYLLLRGSLVRIIKAGFKALVLAAAAFIALYAYTPTFLEPIVRHVANTYTLDDPSTIGHLESLELGLERIISEPAGIGLGRSGPRAAKRSGEFINAENSFIILGFDTGVLGLAIYLFTLMLIFVYLISKLGRVKDGQVREFLRMAISVFIGQMAAWNLLPYIVELEVTLLLFFLIGIAMNAERLDASQRERLCYNQNL